MSSKAKQLVKGLVERSTSKTKKHARFAALFVVKKGGPVEVAKPVAERPVKGTYAIGVAKEVEVEAPSSPDAAVVQVAFTRNIKKQVLGELVVYDSAGRPVLKCVYRKLKVRRSWGDPSYAWAVQATMDFLKLPVKRYNFGTGALAKAG